MIRSSTENDSPATLTGCNTEDEILSVTIPDVDHLMRLTNIHNDGVAGLHFDRLIAAAHFHVTGQQHENFLHVLVVMQLKRRRFRQSSPIDHLDLAELKIIACRNNTL